MQSGKGTLIGPMDGKSTLLDYCWGKKTAGAGQVQLGSKVQIGYFARQHEGLNPEMTVLDEVVYNSDCSRTSPYPAGTIFLPGIDLFKGKGFVRRGKRIGWRC